MLQARHSCAHTCFNRETVLANRPCASGPTSTVNAVPISPLEIPFGSSQGRAASSVLVFGAYGGTNVERYNTGSPVFERVFGLVSESSYLRRRPETIDYDILPGKKAGCRSTNLWAQKFTRQQ